MEQLDTEMNFADWVFLILYGGIFVFTVLVMLSYTFLAIFSNLQARIYIQRNKYAKYDLLLKSSVAPPVSVLAPAYNEEATIVENIRSLLSLKYPRYQVVVVNDGSKDSTLQQCIDNYDLEPIPFQPTGNLDSKRIRQVYRSKNPAFKKLLVVDKENGGKADALNAGLNVAQSPYVMNIDVDCILERDCLQKLMKPFLEETETRVIATGGVIRIANNCKVEGGSIKEVRLPKTLIGRFQTLEYLRAFLLGRMAWGYLDGLLLISGALGVFDRELVMKSGGYYAATVGEDMELVVRMRRYAREHGIKYKVEFIPDPLCWTEVPESWKVLHRQRNRWTRGTIETVLLHKKLFLNPKYGKIGLLSFPYWVFFEWFAPVIEFIGIIFLVIYLALGMVNIEFFTLLLAMVYLFSITISMYTLFMEDLTFFRYKRNRDFRKLILMAFIEPFVFHPFVVWSAVRGNWDFFFAGKKQWGAMKRVGFQQPATPADKKD
ncbi:MAG: glycosyltransferase family 2 protein [Flavobacteriia bacterium]|nr:glycosyltransferase family 2 protein [Flavobacteriia bacterium]